MTYLYWDEKFDEWIDNVERRLAPIHTHTYKKGGELKIGQRVEVLDETNTWLEAFVIESEADKVRGHETYISISYLYNMQWLNTVLLTFHLTLLYTFFDSLCLFEFFKNII